MILYTDIDNYCCSVLRARVADGGLSPGDVWERDINEIRPDELKPYDQIHLFAGIGGFPLGMRWAGWPAPGTPGFSVITGGFPCQDISFAGKGAGLDGEHSGLFYVMHRLAMARRTDWVLCENVGALSSRGMDAVAAAMESAGYLWCGAYRVGAWAFGSPHNRERWFLVFRLGATIGSRSSGASAGGPDQEMAYGAGNGPQTREEKLPRQREDGRPGVPLVHTASPGLQGHVGDAGQPQESEHRYADPQRWPLGQGVEQHPWEPARVYERGVEARADGIPERLVRRHYEDGVRATGNAIVPQIVAAIARGLIEFGEGRYTHESVAVPLLR